MNLRKGDRVRVTTAPWVGELGVIEHVNGGYVNVRMDKSVHKDDVHELYWNEIEPSKVPPPNAPPKVKRVEDERKLYHISYQLDVMVVAESLKDAIKIAAENVNEEYVNLDTSLPDQANLASYIPGGFGPHDDPWGDIEDENEEVRNLDYWLSRNIKNPAPRSSDISLDDYDGTIK